MACEERAMPSETFPSSAFNKGPSEEFSVLSFKCVSGGAFLTHLYNDDRDPALLSSLRVCGDISEEISRAGVPVSPGETTVGRADRLNYRIQTERPPVALINRSSTDLILVESPSLPPPTHTISSHSLLLRLRVGRDRWSAGQVEPFVQFYPVDA
ncbi:hypothetical protein CEXT_297461 [Caerostris extrusa]|uniref:Uncharacterized protein n=1 Tax=Caerostris extrusa TaxID=172846 RepID=A0AAV4MEQ6_CAEEX|nr:hypothetical protein CEXT_297461 [Caerostris extrusa]